jgi:hypothetical protein
MLEKQTLDAQLCVAKAQSLWVTMDDNEKTLVRFGMLPFDKMAVAEQEGYDGQQLAVALMQCAKADGGMCA